jgi:hypothetical protein
VTGKNGARQNEAKNYLKIDLRFVDIEYELWALGHMLRVIEPAIEYLNEADERQTLSELEEAGLEVDEADRDLAWQDVHEKREHVLPRFMRGPLLVAIWAAYESGVTTVADIRAREMGTTLLLKHLREGFFERAQRYYGAVLGMPLDDDGQRRERLASLYAVRNAFAHANGRKDTMPADRWDELKRTLAPSQISDWRGTLVPSHYFVAEAYDDVAASLRSLVSRAKGPLQP